MYCAQMCVYLGDCFAHRYETSPSDYIDYIKRFYVKKLILTDVTIRSVFQNPVTYSHFIYQLGPFSLARSHNYECVSLKLSYNVLYIHT